MKKIGVLLCLVALTTGAFASQTTGKKLRWTAVERKVFTAELKDTARQTPEMLQALSSYKEMASTYEASEFRMILPAISAIANIYMANREVYKEFAKEINRPVTFKGDMQMNMTRYISQFTSETDKLDAFQAALEEDCNVVAKSAAQLDFEKLVANFANEDINAICQVILTKLADPMRDANEEEAATLAKEYVKYQVNGVALVEYLQPIIEHDSMYQHRIAELTTEIENCNDGTAEQLKQERTNNKSNLMLKWYYTAFFELEDFYNKIK